MRERAKIHPSQWRLILVSRQWSAHEPAAIAAMMAIDCARLSKLCGERVDGHWTLDDVERTAMRSAPTLPANPRLDA